MKNEEWRGENGPLFTYLQCIGTYMVREDGCGFAYPFINYTVGTKLCLYAYRLLPHSFIVSFSYTWCSTAEHKSESGGPCRILP